MININNLTISNMRIKDLDSISQNLPKDFDDFYNYNILKNELNSTNSYYFIIKYNDEIIGFAGITVILDEVEINNIVIKKSFRGNDISKLLLEHLIKVSKENNCKKINLEVNSENFIAINLYKQFEFKNVGLRKCYYNGKDAILMSKFI